MSFVYHFLAKENCLTTTKRVDGVAVMDLKVDTYERYADLKREISQKYFNGSETVFIESFSFLHTTEES